MSARGTEYTCECCKGVFLRERSDDEAMAVAFDLHGPPDQQVWDEGEVIVCDDCFHKLMAALNNTDARNAP